MAVMMAQCRGTWKHCLLMVSPWLIQVTYHTEEIHKGRNDEQNDKYR